MIKAVIVVGNDGNDFIEEEKKVADFLKELGVSVVELYTPNCKWADVKVASEDANIFIYAGHGITYGDEKQGTLYLNEGIIEGPSLVEGLKLHKNALVLFNHACSSAGSSAADDNDIGIKEATKRVEDYAKPFVKIGAAGYYANNYNDYIIPVLTKFFNGQPIKEIYNNDANKWTKVENRKGYSFKKGFEVAVASKPGDGYFTRTSYINGKKKVEKLKEFKSYDVSYVGIPTFTVYDFFK